MTFFNRIDKFDKIVNLKVRIVRTTLLKRCGLNHEPNLNLFFLMINNWKEEN